VNEANKLALDGFEYRARLIKVKIVGLLADAPARALCTFTTQHNGHFGCSKCTSKGKTVKAPGETRGRTTFPDIDAPMRSDYSFRSRFQPGHHKEQRSILETLHGFDMVKGIPIDPMHLLGISSFIVLLNEY